MKHTEVTADGHKKTRRTRRIAVVSIAALAVAVGGGVAYAYWTAGGSGNGTAATGDTQPLKVNQTSVVTGLYPGGPTQDLEGDFDNPNPGPIRVNGVTLSIASVTKAVGAPAGVCDATDYTITQPDPVSAEVPSGNGQGAWTGATIQFNNKPAANQDGCKGATVNLHYEVN